MALNLIAASFSVAAGSGVVVSLLPRTALYMRLFGSPFVVRRKFEPGCYWLKVVLYPAQCIILAAMSFLPGEGWLASLKRPANPLPVRRQLFPPRGRRHADQGVGAGVHVQIAQID